MFTLSSQLPKCRSKAWTRAPWIAIAVTLSFGAFGSQAAQAAEPLSWSSPELANHQTPYGNPAQPHGISCPTIDLCVAADDEGNVLTSTDPTGDASAWTTTKVDYGRENQSSASCPSTTLCVVTYDQDILTSTNPTGGPGAWTATNVESGDELEAVSCPTTSLCVAVDYDGNVLTSTDPTGGVGAWSTTWVGDGLLGISCPSTTLCVAVDYYGNVITSSDPTGGEGAWKTTNVDSNGYLEDISCATRSSQCVAIDFSGNVVTSTDPTGGQSAWTTTNVESAASESSLENISCPTTTLCVGMSSGGHVVTSTDPTGGASTWQTSTRVDNAFSSGLSCPTSGLCVAVDNERNAFTSTNPTGGASAWAETATGVDDSGVDPLGSVSCPSASLCVAGESGPNIADPQGWVVTSVNPLGGTKTWMPESLTDATEISDADCLTTSLCIDTDSSLGSILSSTDPAAGVATLNTTGPFSSATQALSCPTSTFCAAVGYTFETGGAVMTSTDPTGSASAWTTSPIDPGQHLTIEDISCPTTSLCVAVDNEGNVVTSTDPTGGEGAWTASNIDGHSPLLSVSCPTTTLCVAVGYTANIYVSTNPTGGASAWTEIFLPVPYYTEMTGVSCPSASMCVAVNDEGDVVTSVDPTGGEDAWTATPVDEDYKLNAVSCASTSFCVAVDSGGNVVIGTSGSNDIPTNTSPPTIAGSAIVGQMLTAKTGAWTNNPSSYTYQWYRCDSPSGIKCEPIAEATSSTYTVANSDLEQAILVAVAAHNAAGEGNPARSDATGLVVGTSDEEHGTSGGKSSGEGGVTGGGTTTSTGGGNSNPGSTGPMSSTGSPTATISSAQIASLLTQQLTPSSNAAAITALLKHGELTVTLKALEAGTLAVAWYEVPAGAKLAKHSKAKPVLVASGQTLFNTPGTSKLKIKLTAAGKRLLEHAKQLKLTAKGTFTPKAQTPTSAVKEFTLRR